MENVAKATININNVSLEKANEKELFVLYRDTKAIEVRNELTKRYLYIADILSKKFFNKGIEHEDIYQVASVGLIYAIERFDIAKGYEFSSFATPTIVGEIKKYFRDKGWSIRVPRRIQELSKKVNTAKVHLQQKYQKPPKIEDIAKYLGCSQEDVLEAMEASQGYRPKSLDLYYDNEGEDKDVQLMDLIGEEDKSFKEIENKDFLKTVMKRLDPMEIRIITDRFFKNKTQSNIAKDLDISQMSVSRLEKKIIAKLKKEYERTMQ